MTTAEILQRAFSSVDIPETAAMLVGGFLFGAFVLWLSPTVSGGQTAVSYVALVFSLAGLVFFIGRGVALYFDGSNLWPRNIGFAVLWIIYCVSMGVGIAARRRLT